MSNLGRRLRNLEARLTDESRLMPYSAKWRAYWIEWMEQYVSGRNPPGKITVEAFRAVIGEVEAAHPEWRLEA
jgi:hypothetical protein